MHVMSTRRALLFSFLDRYSGLVLSVASSMVIARLLTPAELGTFSVSMALLLLGATVRDMGAGQYVVQTKELTAAKIRAVWAIQLSIGAALALLVAALAVPAARFYHEPRMALILWIMAVSYLVNPFGSITYAVLMRDMRFQSVALMRIAAGLATAAVSITLASRGHGAVSLAWGGLAGTLANAAVAIAFRPPRMPWWPSLRGTREVLGFGGRIAGTSVINTLVGSAPDFMLGKVQGLLAAGLYSRSNGLVGMFSRLVVDAVYNVALALFAQQRREGEAVGPGFLRAVAYVSVLNWGFMAGLALLAYPVTRLLYGGQWDATVPLTRWLALAGALAAPVPICIAACTAMGRADLVLRTSVLTGVVTLLAVVAGASVNLVTMCMGLAGATLVNMLLWMLATRSVVPFQWHEVLGTARQSAAAAGLAALGPLAIVLWAGQAPTMSWPWAVAGSVAGAAGLLAGLWLTEHPLMSELHRLWPKKPAALESTS